MKAPNPSSRRLFVRPEILPAMLFALIPLLLLVLITALQLFRNGPESEELGAQTAATLRSVRLTNDIGRAIGDAERGQRGYLLTDRFAYLQPYATARERLPGLVGELQVALDGYPEERKRLLVLQANLTTKLNELQATIDAKKRGDPEGALRIIQTDVGRDAMQAIDDDLDFIRDAARTRYASRRAEQKDLQEQFTITFLAGTAVAALALLMGAFLIGTAYLKSARSEGLLRATLDSVREGVLALDRTGTVQASNAGLMNALGPPAAAIVAGRPLPSEVMGNDADLGLDAIVAGLQEEVGRTGNPALIERVDARGRTLEIFHGPAFDGGSVTTFLDVSEQRTYTEVVRQAQKLEALGQMTGGVAHDFNNLLMVIVGNISLLRRSIGDDPKSQKRLKLLAAAADRGARLTRQLLAFARRQPLQPETLNLGHLMTEVLPLVRGAVGASIEVEYVDAGGLWNTTLDAAQFQAAAINLAVNARDAMPEGGKLTVDVANSSLDDLYASRHSEVAAGQYVAFAVTDTGAGMDADTAARAFDPFFTTKRSGEGTGLGLAQVYGFVKQSGGHVKIYSEPGHGTTVRMYFPRTLANASPGAGREATRTPRSGSETLLLVDDDAIVRTTVTAMVEELGYTVLSASSGEEGLALFEQHVATIDLVFTDVVMPGMGGRQLAERIRAVHRTVPILFTSGYTENAIVHNGRLDAGVELISKPYDRESLATKLRHMLDEADSAENA